MKSLMRLYFFNLSFLFLITAIVDIAAQQTVSIELSTVIVRNNLLSQLSYQIRSEYRILEGDIIDLRVFGHPELGAREIRVDERGLIRLPQINDEIRAACLTLKELKSEILSHYKQHSNEKYQISLQLVQINSPPVSLKGAVRVPRLRLIVKTRLLKVLSMAELTENAKGIVEIRHGSQSETCSYSLSDKNTLFTYNIKDIKSGSDESNPYVYPGDSIIVPEREKVYVMGAVIKAGTYLLDESDTLSKVLDKAGGLSANADGKRIEICRRVKGANTGESFLVDLDSVRRKEKEDVELKPDDFINVFLTNHTNGTCKSRLF